MGKSTGVNELDPNDEQTAPKPNRSNSFVSTSNKWQCFVWSSGWSVPCVSIQLTLSQYTVPRSVETGDAG